MRQRAVLQPRTFSDVRDGIGVLRPSSRVGVRNYDAPEFQCREPTMSKLEAQRAMREAKTPVTPPAAPPP